jgi:hypothetical protein
MGYREQGLFKVPPFFCLSPEVPPFFFFSFRIRGENLPAPRLSVPLSVGFSGFMEAQIL